ncbi:DUF3413 domain-containing protein [uncultured Succinatimonas sp.]|uniref:DUF3413 domain-containing protein n=1 Tax=uncultured Succinatimonas sp. TaxID=1262973 RepID=UPI0025F5EA97|nr:DUF3413 domain-containing protein [uncultured Succinatimonas sp.]
MSDSVNYLKNFSYKEQVSRSSLWGHHFLFLNVLLSLLIGLTYVYAAPSTDSFAAFFYLIVTWMGHMGFLAFVTYLIILFPLTFIGNFRYYRVFSVIIAILFHSILLFDAKLYLNVKIHLSLTALNLIFRELDFNTGLNYNFLFIAIPIVIAFELLFAKLATKNLYRNGSKKWVKITSLVFIAAFVSSHCIHIWADATRYDKITILRSAFPAHYPMTAKSFLSSHGWIEGSAKPNNISAIDYPLQPIVSNSSGKPQNIVTIFINGLSYDSQDPKITPYLLSLKQQSESYEQHYLPYKLLKDNLFASSYGVPLLYKDTFLNRNIQPVIFREMAAQEYISRFVISQSSDLDPSVIEKATGARANQIITAVDDNETLNKAAQQIADWDHDRPYSTTVVLSDLFKTKNKNDYDWQLKILDSRIVDLFNVLKINDHYDDTMIIVTSAAGSPFIKSDLTFNRDCQHVPLIIKWPGSDNMSVAVNKLSSPFDLPATVATEILQVTTAPADYSLGENLKELSDRRFIVSDEPEIILIGSKDTTVYSDEGSALIEDNGKALRIRPNLENLIRAMRTLNRFKE